MVFKRLGASGLQIPIISLGGWLTYGKCIYASMSVFPDISILTGRDLYLIGGTIHGDPVKEIIKTAFEAGIN